MLKHLMFSASFAAIALAGSAQITGKDPYAVTFIKDGNRPPDETWQARLRAGSAWQQFVALHPGWRVEFNEHNGKPHQAYGPGIATTGATPEERAWSFLTTEAAHFVRTPGDLQLRNIHTTAKHHFVSFEQQHNGENVLWGRALVKMDLQGHVISFSLDVYDFPAVLLQPTISDAQLGTAASAGVTGDVVVTLEPALAWLPKPVFHATELRPVRKVRVEKRDPAARADLHAIVDAITGELLYRQNDVLNEQPPEDAGADVTFVGTVSTTIPEPLSVLPLRNLNFTADGQNFTTGPNGGATTGIPGPINFSAPLAGSWGTVYTDGNTPTLTGTLLEGANEVSFDGSASLEELSAYYHVNNIHDHAVAVLPGFTGMDVDLAINVDLTTGDCNANYDNAATSINFFVEGNDCYSLARVNDVVYHEYGHGVNRRYYDGLSAYFSNGAMNEGYADVWAFSLSLNPILAQGYKISTPAAFIRRYDAEPKVFPVDLIGEPHADGEIIAGAWWDTYVNLGNDMDHTMDLFALAFPGVQAEAPDGSEGEAYRDVLLAVLEADDDDNNLLNSTPNGTAIAEAFRRHGITLISGFDVVHTPVETANEQEGILIEASASVSSDFDIYVLGLELNYRVNLGSWQELQMTNTGGDNYEAVIPGQPRGSVISYYIGLEDVNNALSGVVPIGADLADPGLPNYILVGFELERTDNVDNLNELGDWDLGVAGDNNSTGTWELYDPNPTYSTVDESLIQPDLQHTPGGEFCLFTGNASVYDSLVPGTNDVDGGRTTLRGDPNDLSGYENPTFTLYRWYTNSPPGGANPGADWWQVEITNNGTDWVYVENTRTDERNWRRLAFRVQDYVTPNSTVQLRFIASDSTHVGQDLDGGSLIEAAVDDIQLWDNRVVGIEENAGGINAVFPDPANEELNVVLDPPGRGAVTLEILDPSGRVVLTRSMGRAEGRLRTRVDVSALSAGGYVVRARWPGGSAVRRFSIVR